MATKPWVCEAVFTAPLPTVSAACVAGMGDRPAWTLLSAHLATCSERPLPLLGCGTWMAAVSEPPATLGAVCSLVVTVCLGEQPALPPTGAQRHHCTRTRPSPARLSGSTAAPQGSSSKPGRVPHVCTVKWQHPGLSPGPTAWLPRHPLCLHSPCRRRRHPVPSAHCGNWLPLEPQHPAGLMTPRAPSHSPLS